MLPTARRLPGPPVHPTEVVASWSPTPSTHAVRLQKPAGFHFRPTQFTFLGLPTPEGADWRPMSLATSPTREHLEYAVRVSDSAFKQAFAKLGPGDRAWVRGPFGEFVLNEQRAAMMIAGGIGITPLKGMAEYAADRELPISIRLLYSSRTEEEIAFRTELEGLAKRNPRFIMRVTLTRPANPGWEGETGRISTHQVQELASPLERPMYYVCGTPQFVQDQLDQLVRMGVPETDLDWEPFRGY
jgi:glycine betaine catabolism B